MLNLLRNIFNDKTKKFLLGVSGGVDSMVLLHLMHSEKLNIGVAHCNFKLREKEARQEALIVKKKVKELKIPFYYKEFETKSYTQKEGISIQMAARELRYNWFNEILEKEKYDYIVVAHHLNDQIETFFLNLTRGSGLQGLTGMKFQNNRIIRPLLQNSKQEILTYAKTHKIEFLNDSSNAETKYKRNFLRHKIIPEFNNFNNAFTDIMQRNLELLSKQNEIYQKHIETTLSKNIISTENEVIKIDIGKLKKHHHSEVYLYEYLKGFGFTFDQTCNMLMVKDSGRVFNSETYEITINREDVLLRKALKKHSQEIIEIKKNIKNVTYPLKLSFHEIPVNETIINQGKKHAFFDYDKIIFPIQLRRWKYGDYFCPLGMKGKKKLSDFLTDLKKSQFEKDETHVLISDNKIIWVIGERIDNRFKITDSTKQVLVVELNT